jgi:hypothetical protein
MMGATAQVGEKRPQARNGTSQKVDGTRNGTPQA